VNGPQGLKESPFLETSIIGIGKNLDVLKMSLVASVLQLRPMLMALQEYNISINGKSK